MIGIDGERVSGSSVLSVWLDDDDIYIYMEVKNGSKSDNIEKNG